MNVPAPIRWEGGKLWLLDQQKLPEEVVYEEQTSTGMVAASIATMKVRGAPAIGIAAAYGMALAARDGEDLVGAARVLVAARPTAVNLAWAVNRVLQAHDAVAEAEAIHREDAEMCHAIGANGMGLIGENSAVLTHCNAGALAVSALGTATAPLYLAHDAGVRFRVFVDETRPLLQGARLTAWELLQAGLDVTLICDSTVSHLMSEGMVDLVIVGADRVTANGDVVNKIGTRGIAIASRYHGIPFHVAFPSSTFDADSASGADVDIEQRDAGEVTGPIRAAPGVHVRNPAFDVTPAELVTSWITDRGRIGSARDLAKLK
ncbi:MAG: S-methyl-5-thioribose-1-phosphate isomerase [Gammaproteobacteria bacterium]|nr:S-methyl-5-thioribose-1-phosphate isomerase [Gammaproteobacteria bacterium]